MNILLAVFIVLAALSAMANLVALVMMWSVRKQPGTFYAILLVFFLAVYELSFLFLLAMSTQRAAGANNTDLIAVWLLGYILSDFGAILFALYTTGRISEHKPRQWFARWLGTVEKKP